MTNEFIISNATLVKTDYLIYPVIKNAVSILERDIQKCTKKTVVKNEISLNLDKRSSIQDDQFIISFISSSSVEVKAKTELGILYGVLAISREIMEIDDFWYWFDTPITKKDSITWNHFDLTLPDYQVKYRGWFINDELLLMNWQDFASNSYVWQRIFETAVRVGCNVIIPGTDINSQINRKAASEFGLIIAHHHAEPLGAKMFAREYPNLTASFIKYPDIFRKLWYDAIIEQQNTNTIYSLGFRGQGDKPFWLDDTSRIWTEESKADIINQIIQEQYDMVKQLDSSAITVVNIYGELTSMYNQGLIKIPNDTIEIWADSGYGKMVSRRQAQNNPRSKVLSVPNPFNHQRGIYYHVAFHDLQASNFLGLMSNSPEFVSSEITQANKHNLNTLQLINTGNIKPHIIYLREVAKSWQQNYVPRSNEEIIDDYVKHYYSSEQENIKKLYLQYWKTIVQYGKYSDETAGDEFAPYLIRRIIKAWISNSNKLTNTAWLTGDTTINESLNHIQNLIKPKLDSWNRLVSSLQSELLKITGSDIKNLYNDLYLSVIYQASGLNALDKVIIAYHAFQNNESKLSSFLLINDAYHTLKIISDVQNNNPSDKWRDFYKNDGYNNIPLAIKQISFIRHYIRTIGDNADLDAWERKFLKTPSEARIMTLWTIRPELSDEYLASKLHEKFLE
jgi:hypothetical protein